ncbi:hypothetical protein F1654_11135 [Alkalicaulis satelles]|uniref:STAS/SEC14 domain-containing protein n=1 Tax=Alkalicaulis satelles TaxID=2609175 RepID=A0A5M6ZDS2_9PROT|nr:hypothetical protein [Alkalicaulis satelles]KAA5802370.1 hypothetical protein F1654_11135 [Alkalicaulis satelles]
MSGPIIHACDVAPDCRYIGIIGHTHFKTTMDNAQRLIDRIGTGQYASVVIDYRQADLVLSPPQYADFFRLTGPAIQKLERFAYLYNERTWLYAAHASRSIQALGVPARAFQSWDEAAAFLEVSGPDPAMAA